MASGRRYQESEQRPVPIFSQASTEAEKGQSWLTNSRRRLWHFRTRRRPRLGRSGHLWRTPLEARRDCHRGWYRQVGLGRAQPGRDHFDPRQRGPEDSLKGQRKLEKG